MSLKFWGNILSQPSRTVQYVLKKFNIEHEFIYVNIPNGTRSEEFKSNVNPAGALPVIEHDGEKFFESATLLRYLLDTFKNNHTLLPSSDRKLRAQIESLLDRNGNTYRPNIAGAMMQLVVIPKIFGGPEPTAEEATAWMEKVNQSYKELNRHLVRRSFLCGDFITIADIQIYNEVYNGIAIGGFSIEAYPHLQRWKSDIETDLTVEELNYEFAEALKKLIASKDDKKTSAEDETHASPQEEDKTDSQEEANTNSHEENKGTSEEENKVTHEDPTPASITKDVQDDSKSENKLAGSLSSGGKGNMPYRRLGNSGLKVSVLTYGTWLTAANPEEEQTVIDCVKAAYNGGITTFDTAEVYGFGVAETLLGKALKELNCDRSELVVITKIFKSSNTGMNDRFLSKKHIIESLENSLKRLQLDYVDVIFAHRPDFETTIEETCRAFDWLIEEGYAFYWATSEWPVERITRAIEYCEAQGLNKPIADQCEYSAMVRKNTEEGLRFAYERYSYGTTIWSPLVGGLLAGKYNTLEPPEGSRYKDDPTAANFLWPKYIKEFGEEGLKERLQGLSKIAEDLGCTQAQLCVAWCIVNKDISTTIIGASKVSQIESNLAAIEVAKNWTPELEDRISKLLDNNPASSMDFNVWQPMKSRREQRIDFHFGK